MNKRKTTSGGNGDEPQKGYNEKNPTETQGAFKADAMATKSPGKENRVKGPGIKKQYSKK